MRSLFTILCAITVHTACAQISLVPIPHTTRPASNAGNAAARTKASQSLPFWDDFSDVVNGDPSADLWFAGKSTWVNDGLAVNPPSINVASFDGLDSLGKPYSVNDVLAKGFADKLESHPIDLAAVPTAERSSVYLSFYYQIKGLGELPDGGDKLILEFRTADSKWEQVWTMENTGTQQLDVFTQVVLPVAAKFFHSEFKFRFKNFARLSGPYDTWHIDYVYLNKGRTATDTSYPDRSIVSPLTSVFDTYHALPKEHFFVDKDEVLTNPSIVVHNLRTDPSHIGQPVSYYSYAQVEEYNNGSFVKSPQVLLDSAGPVGLVEPLDYMTAEVTAEDLSGLLDEAADSIHLWLKVGLSTGDNVLPGHGPTGDYDVKYAPIDFRHNDTTRSEYWLSSYYAYDDGTAEYGAALNQPGAQVAYEFNLVGVNEGYINALQLFFPRFGDETQQVIELRIWSDLLEQDASVLYREVVTLQRSEQNVFWRKKLTKSVKVGQRFYVGWKQSSSSVIAIGFDKNTNTADKIHFNINGIWEQDTTVLAGSLMIRPIFLRKSDEPDPDEVVGVSVRSSEDAEQSVFPNPSDGSFIIPGQVSNISLIDMSGSAVGFAQTEGSEETQVTIVNPAPGLYVLRYFREGAARTCKLLVR